LSSSGSSSRRDTPVTDEQSIGSIFDLREVQFYRPKRKLRREIPDTRRL
jgi:hypothetical protein